MHSTSDSDADYSEIHAGNLTLYLKLVPENPEINMADTGSIISYARKHKQQEGKKPEVGKITYIAAILMKNHKETNAAFNLKIIQTEKEKIILELNSKNNNGSLYWGQQFYDGGPYRVEIHAQDLSTDASLQTSLVTEVTGIEPPSESIVKSLLLLLLITTAGIPAGIFLGKIKIH
jgi:hypothetical protein